MRSIRSRKARIDTQQLIGLFRYCTAWDVMVRRQFRDHPVAMQESDVRIGIATIALRPGMSLTAMSASPCRATDASEAPRSTRCTPQHATQLRSLDTMT